MLFFVRPYIGMQKHLQCSGTLKAKYAKVKYFKMFGSKNIREHKQDMPERGELLNYITGIYSIVF
jgi:hypothetical protein